MAEECGTSGQWLMVSGMMAWEQLHFLLMALFQGIRFALSRVSFSVTRTNIRGVLRINNLRTWRESDNLAT